MKFKTGITALVVLLGWAVGQLNAQEVREIIFNEDRDQEYMCSKVYKLEHVKAVDMTPFVLGAVRRYNSESSVERLNYKFKKEQYLVVNTGVAMMPYVDAMIKALDRPGKLDANGSLIDDTGISRCTYCPKYRADANLVTVIDGIRSGDGRFFFDAATNMYYWKDSPSDCAFQKQWLLALDRPVPQVDLALNVYEISESDFKELGIDFVSWKNGPGATLAAAGWDWTNFKSVTDVGNLDNALNIITKGPAADMTGIGGFLVAPNIDATFLRMLAQKGKARIATSGHLTVVNDFLTGDPGDDNFDAATYRLRFTPAYQTITKDDEQMISVGEQNDDFYFYVRNPIISFFDAPLKAADTTTVTTAASIMFGWVLNIQDTAEKTHDGTSVVNNQVFRSWNTLHCGTEKLIATYSKDHSVDQYNGIPFLKDIPGVKYLFGAAADSKTKSRVFVTVKASPVAPEASLAPWAGRVIETTELIKDSK